MRVALIALLLAAPSFAWNQVGHQVIAAICYDELPGKVRDKVDALIRQHPEYQKWTKFARGKAERWAFIKAAGWPDDIRGDQRFYTDTVRNPEPTPLVAGYPDMRRHTNWHQINNFFSPDGTVFPTNAPTPNVVTQVSATLNELTGENAVYFLPWFEHLVGDLHQPLHSTSRWVAWNKDSNGRLQSDAGGNGVNVDGFTNLHTVWDDLLGNSDDYFYVEWMRRRIVKEHKAEANPDLSPEHWAQVGLELAKAEVYKFPASVGSAENPFRRTPEYVQNAMALARRQAALAGRRMAALLTQKLQ